MKAYQVFMTRETGDNRVRDAKQTMEKRPRKNNGKTEVPQSRRNMSLCVVFALMALGIVFNACKKDELADFPSPPTGVTANAQSSSSIRVSWQPVSNATSYEVYYEIGNSTNKIYAGTTSSTSYTHSGLQANTTYYYCIKSVNSSGSSNYSSYASATTTLGTGSIKVVSTSSNPYEIYLDGVYKFDLAGGANRTISNVSTGTHTVRVLQISGYILYPTDKTYNVTVQSGYIHTVTFP